MFKEPRFTGPRARHVLGVALGLCVASLPLGAQWRNLPTDGIPRGADGKPDMNAPAPRTAAGKPDLSGIYQPNTLLPEPGRGCRPRQRADDRRGEKDSRRARHRPARLRRTGRALSAAGRAEDQHGAGAVQDRADRQAGRARLRSIQPVAAGVPRRSGVGRRSQPVLAGILKRTLGRRRARRRDARPQRQAVARSRRAAGERQADGRRTVPSPAFRPARDPAHDQRSDLLHEAVDGDDQRAAAARHRAVRVHLQREREVQTHMGPNIK